MKTQFETLEAKNWEQQETLNDFIKSLFKIFSKNQQVGSSASTNKQLDWYEVTRRGYQEYDNGYPQMKVEFPTRWGKYDNFVIKL